MGRNTTSHVLTDDIRLPFSLGEKRKLRAARGSGITCLTLSDPHSKREGARGVQGITATSHVMM